MQTDILYGILGVGIGAGAMYLLIQQNIIPSPNGTTARARVNSATQVARTPMRANARPVVNAGPTQYAGKFSSAGSNGRTFGGVVTAQSIPSQYARSGILARPSSQSFSEPSHADLIRID